MADIKLERLEPLPALMEAVAGFDGDDALCREWLLARAVADERWADAEKWGVQALHIRVKNPDTHRLLGQAYLKSGHTDLARRALTDALELDPQDQAAKELLDSLPEE
jgi:Flp pilus assembly protein TadD